MNWFKENPVLAAILAFAVLGTAVTGWFAFDASARLQEATDGFNSQITTLRSLQGSKPFPDAENAKKVSEAVAEYEKSLSQFIAHLAGLEAPLDTALTPQEFQDRLREAVDALRSKAAQKGVTLPEKFFYGFDDFQTQLPTQEQTAPLNREFTAIRNLVDSLVDLPVQSIDDLVRHPKPEKTEDGDDQKKLPGGEAAPESTTFDSFSLSITALQEKFVSAFNKIPDSGAFLIVRSLAIENSNPVPPPRAEPTPASSSPADTFADTSASASEQLPVVFGREAVKATFLFEILDFPGQSGEGTANPDAAPPGPAGN